MSSATFRPPSGSSVTERKTWRLYPRLLRSEAARLAARHAGATLENLVDYSGVDHPKTIFTPTGGTRAGREILKELQRSLREVAEETGYPEGFPDAPSIESRQRFDFRIARHLHETMQIAPGEAAKVDVWEFISCVLVPDLVRWRFPGTARSNFRTSTERYLGGVRNTLERLWWRGEVICKAGDYEPLENLNEDELVQIMERPFLASHRELTRLIVRRFGELTDLYPEIDRMDVMRDAQKRFRRLMPVYSFSGLGEDEVDFIVQEVLSEAAGAISRVDVDWENARSDGRGYRVADQVDELLGDLDTRVEPLDRAVLDVLFRSYPEWRTAREIADTLNESSHDFDEPVNKSRVNSCLYIDFDSLVEKTDGTPPEWRLRSALFPEEFDARTTVKVREEQSEIRLSFSGDGRGVEILDLDAPPESFESQENLRQTILRRLIEFQRKFFAGGEMKPLSQKDLARELQADASTISRAIEGVTIFWRGGETPARDLFQPGIHLVEGMEVSAHTFGRMFTWVIMAENLLAGPLTDERVGEILRDAGVRVARRTIAKCRESHGFPSSSERETGPARLALKRLAPVETEVERSNQHELNAGRLRKALKIQEREVPVFGDFSAIVYSSDREPPVRFDTTYTLYDARKNTRGRTEYRLYCKGSDFFEGASAGDLLVLIRPDKLNDDLSVLIVRQGTRLETRILETLSLDEAALSVYEGIVAWELDEERREEVFHLVVQCGLAALLP